MHRIVFVSTYSLAEPVLKNRLSPFLDMALSYGYKVTLVNPAGGESHLTENCNFFHNAIKVQQANRGNFFFRAVREGFLAYRVISNIPKDADVVFITIPSMFLLFLYRNKKNFFSIIDIRDLTWEYLGGSPSLRLVKNIFRRLACWKLPSFNAFTVTNRCEFNFLANKAKVKTECITICPNGVSEVQFESLSSFQTSPLKKSAARLCVSYIGNVGVAQNLFTLVEAARLMPEFDFRIVGTGSEVERIRFAANKVTNLKMVGRIDWSEVPAEYARADILWAQLTPQFSGAVPSKLYEYLSTGKYVVYGGKGEAVSLAENFENIKVIPPENVIDLMSAIKKIKKEGSWKYISHNNRNRIESNFIRERSVICFFEKVFKQGS